MKRLAIIGSGDLGQLIAYHAIDSKLNVVGFFDDFANIDTRVDNIPVLGKIDTVESSYKAGTFDEIIVAIGYKHIEFRKSCFLRFKNIIPFATIIHSSSYIDKSAQLGEGIVILPGCVIDRNVRIENNILINVGTTISHDSIINDNTFIAPRVAIAGFVSIGQCCNMGINTTVIDNITIVNNVFTGGGTVVIKNIQTPGLYVGNPARFIR